MSFSDISFPDLGLEECLARSGAKADGDLIMFVGLCSITHFSHSSVQGEQNVCDKFGVAVADYASGSLRPLI